jgi:NTE family protein
VQLVDGGVHDNQGIQALLDMNCDALIISDASGLMADKRKPSPYAVSVAGRSSSIYGTRIRIEQIVRSTTTLPTALMHLLSGVRARTVDPLWFDSPDPPPDPPLTDYGINREIQRCLARVRTDLDAFSEVEAHALMYSGYRMSALQLDNWTEVKPWITQPGSLIDAAAWPFGPAASRADVANPPPSYKRVLAASRSRFFKFLLAVPNAARVSLVAAFAAAVGGGAWGAVDNWSTIQAGFDWGWPSWWWATLAALLPASLSLAALLQLAGGKLYLWLGRASRV